MNIRRLVSCITSAIFFASVWVESAIAEEGAVPRTLAKTSIEPGATDQLLKVTLGLAAIVGLIFLIAWLAKRMGYTQFGGNDQFKVVASLAVGQRERLIIVEVGDEQIVVGVAPGRVSKIHEIENKIEVTDNNAANLFSNKFKQAMKSRGAK